MTEKAYRQLFELIDRHRLIIERNLYLSMQKESEELSDIGVELMILKNTTYSEEKISELRKRLIAVLHKCFEKYDAADVDY